MIFFLSLLLTLHQQVQSSAHTAPEISNVYTRTITNELYRVEV
jgi:hypothetical protein